jgi:LPS export ABC transporter protein LptC
LLGKRKAPTYIHKHRHGRIQVLDHRISQNRKKILIAFSVSFLLLVALLITRQFAPGPEKGHAGDFRHKSSLSFASLEGLSLVEKNENEPHFSITAKKAHLRNRKVGFMRVAFQKVVEMEDVAVSFNGNNEGSTEIKSDRAIMNPDSKDITFKGNVVCTTRDGKVLKTGRLFLDRKRKTLKTNEEYEFTGSDGVIHKGRKFESNNFLGEINFGDEFINYVEEKGSG